MRYKFLLPLFALFAFGANAQVMFPGDLNNDGEANHIDLIPLCIAYGQTGPERFFPTLDWIPQETTPWEVGLPVTGIDLSFVDTDGNGRIDSLDLDAIALNYDTTQVDAFPPPQPYLLPDTFPVIEKPVIRLSFTQDQAMPGDTVMINVDWIVPNPEEFPLSNPPTVFACTISFDPEFIDEENIFYVPDPGATDLMYITANTSRVEFGRFTDSGNIELAFGGRGQGALAMSRSVGTFIVIIEDMILLEGNPDFDIEDPLLINSAEEVIEMDSQINTLMVTDTELILPPPSVLQVYPNPSSGSFRICGLEFTAKELSLHDHLGRRLPLRFKKQDACQNVDLSSYPTGTYWLRTGTQAVPLVKWE